MENNIIIQPHPIQVQKLADNGLIYFIHSQAGIAEAGVRRFRHTLITKNFGIIAFTCGKTLAPFVPEYEIIRKNTGMIAENTKIIKKRLFFPIFHP